MNAKQKTNGLHHLLRNCPDVLTPRQVASWTHHGKNTVYALIHSGELPAYRYRGGFLISKSDLIDYLAAHSDDKPDWQDRIGRDRDEQ